MKPTLVAFLTMLSTFLASTGLLSVLKAPPDDRATLPISDTNSLPSPWTLQRISQNQEEYLAPPSISVGANMHASPHWGYPEMYPRTMAGDVDTNMAEAQRMGARVIRIFNANSLISDETSAQRLGLFLDKAAFYGLSVVVSLHNHGCWAVSNGSCDYGYFPQGLNSYFTPRSGSTTLFLNNSFFTDSKGVSRLKEYVGTVVTQNRNHSNIYAWEIGNELDNASIDTSNGGEAMVTFMNDMAAFIRGIDDTHPLSTGFSHMWSWTREPVFYTQMSGYDIISIHPYDGDRGHTPIADWAAANSKTVVAGEIAFSGSDRISRAQTELDYWKEHGVVAALQWGFMAPELPAQGGYDSVYGMDAISHDDYYGLFDLYSSYNRTNPSPTPTSSATPAPTQDFADVPPDHPYYGEIEALYQAGYTAGCNTNPLMYCPDNAMNRAESAVFVERGIHTAAYAPPMPSSQAFADLPLDSWAASWVHGLWEDQYTAGCGTNPLIYCPWQGHTRAEGCVFYLRMLHGANYDPAQPSQQTFADVPLDTWYAKWVQAAYDAGLIPVCQTAPEARFCPNDPLSRGLAAYMMVQAKGLTVP